MRRYWLKLTLESDAAFGRGDGVAGVVNAEVQHDPYGLPYLGGKTLKGLLTAACGEVLYALDQSGSDVARWEETADWLFGRPGSRYAARANLHVGAARLPADLRRAVAADVTRGAVTRETVLETLTTLRRQTAMDAERGTPLDNTLRTIRVVLRGAELSARLDLLAEPEDEARMLALLTACVSSLRRLGAGRNRGLGRVTAALYEDAALARPVAVSLADHFLQETTA